MDLNFIANVRAFCVSENAMLIFSVVWCAWFDSFSSTHFVCRTFVSNIAHLWFFLVPCAHDLILIHHRIIRHVACLFTFSLPKHHSLASPRCVSKPRSHAAIAPMTMTLRIPIMRRTPLRLRMPTRYCVFVSLRSEHRKHDVDSRSNVSPPDLHQRYTCFPPSSTF